MKQIYPHIRKVASGATYRQFLYLVRDRGTTVTYIQSLVEIDQTI